MEGVAESVALELTEGRLGVLALVDGHALVKTNLIALSAEGLVTGARITNSEADRHREKSIALISTLEVLFVGECFSVLLVSGRIV